MTKRVFISYSQPDREVARMLDGSLTIAGIRTFLDERDIRVGDSIPAKIYDGLDSSSHVLYLVSRSSALSLWAKEELSLAKTLEKERPGFKVLPVLLDDCELPTVIKSTRYADLRQWRDPAAYRAACLELLAAINVEPMLGNTWQVQLWTNQGSHIQHALRTLRMVYGCADAAHGRFQNFEQFVWLRRMVTEDLEYFEALHSLKSLIRAVPDARTKEILAAAINDAAAAGTVSFDRTGFPREQRAEVSREVIRLHETVGRLLSVVEAIETEVWTVVSSVLSRPN